MKKKQFVVIGLGSFGGSLVEEFHTKGAEVLAIDQSLEKVEKYRAYATLCVQMTHITEASLTQIGIRNFDHAFVSFGDDVESSTLTTMLLKEMGISQVWVKAADVYHKRVLEKVGADRVIHPEQDMAKRIAHHVISDSMIDYIQLSKEHGIVEMVASSKIHNQSILDLDVRAKYGCTIIGIQRAGETIVSPSANEVIHQGDILIMVGSNDCLYNFEEKALR
ncbi:TrkA family potassium uptake protein [Cytobacillus oceanisediminis]|uniref:TrkA family potassium uptake protein n=1 Tax=Niallia alba TaxID=2729105 RepID=A0A7Y0K556_9BACI|nr:MULTISPECIES: TrkA family potassium uptake protein [Bacillaceae]MBZ9536572.1 TrkA family potassium uptake protein [Cytobacillus oceanisediminis]NMO75881.1 TrkA family potassium uptake protein [Niallia alba]UTI43679.1 TrkA family potassium uptake protein [Niallia sp. RD1]